LFVYTVKFALLPAAAPHNIRIYPSFCSRFYRV